jgi:predicted ferric reductase
MRRRPYRVVEVREEPGDVWTLSMTPDGHAGLRFEAGQYGWITLADSPFTLQQHPYSFSSSAEHPERLEFTIKALGDFSGSIGERGDGARAYIEGPYGSFTFTDPSARGAVFIAGGIGVTPFMSMLRTMRDRNDSRHFMLFYGNERIEDIVFREEIGRLQQVLNLEVHHVLEHPPADWDGLDGLVSTEMLEAHLPQAGASDYHYYICGPEPMIDVAEPTLIDRGLPLSRIYAERFSIV